MACSDKELVFAKDMAYAMGDHLTAEWIPDGYTHTFITRHPRSTAASYLKVIDQQLAGEFFRHTFFIVTYMKVIDQQLAGEFLMYTRSSWKPT